jgi:hypothetical protein
MTDIRLSSIATGEELYRLRRELMNELVRIGKLRSRVAKDPATLIRVVHYRAALKVIWKYINLDRVPICDENEAGLYSGNGEYVTLPDELARYHLPKSSILYEIVRRAP